MGEPAVAKPRKPIGRSKRDSKLVRLGTEFNLARADMFTNAAKGLGGRNGSYPCNRWVPKPRLDQNTLECLYSQAAIIARICDREPDDCTREGFTVRDLSVEDQESLDDWLTENNYLGRLADAARWGNLFGGGAVFMQIEDGRPWDQPVDTSNIFAIRNLHVFDRNELVADQWDDDLGSQRLGLPRTYRLAVSAKNDIIHADRLLLFDGVRVTRQMRLENEGWGGSVVDQVWEQFEQWCVTHSYLAESVTQHTQGVLKLKNLAKAMKSGNAKNVQKRLQAMLRGLSAIGDLVLDQDGEDYVVHTRSMTGFKEALEAFTAGLVAATPQPRSILMGETPGGLTNGEAAGDWKAWTSFCGSKQKTKYQPPTRKFLDFLFRSTLSPVRVTPPRIVIDWNPLFEMDPLVEAQIHASNSTARSADITSGVVSPDEARRQDDVAQSYHLTDEEVADTGAGVATADRKKTPRAELPEPPKLFAIGRGE